MADLVSSFENAASEISSIKTFTEISKSAKELKASAGNSFSKLAGQATSQLNNVATAQKRYLREPPSSIDSLLNLIGLTNGTGPQSLQFLRQKMIEASVAIEPRVKGIIKDEAVKAVGCSQEQTYPFTIPSPSISGASTTLGNITSLESIPVSQGIYLPVSNLDFFSNLKNSPESLVGKTYYENETPSVDTTYLPYGGDLQFPMNKELFQRMTETNVGRSYSTEYGKYYQGISNTPLFDIQYVKENEFGVSGDYYRIGLVDRSLSSSTQSNLTDFPANKVGSFLNDYYGTINIIDSADIATQIVNIITGAVSIDANLGPQEITNESKFHLILERILGLCFDSRREIDVSGISKIAELDGVDESFFEFTEPNLRNIDIRINNVQNGVMEFIDCNNVKVPVDSKNLVDLLAQFRESQSGLTASQKVKQIEKIIDSISQNPNWKAYFPYDFNVQMSINKNVLKQLPLAVASKVISPKVLLPIFTMLAIVESQGKNTYNQAVTSGNTAINFANTTINSANTLSQSANTFTTQVNNLIANGVDFIKKFRTFVIELVSKIGSIYIETLFDILKRDIINLISLVVSDLKNSQKLKRYAIIQALLEVANYALAISQLISDYRKCKSLVADILLILKLISRTTGIGLNDIPGPLLALAAFLPGTSPERATINTLKYLQELGIPTGTMPDGSPNLMGLMQLSMHKGSDMETAQNGKVSVVPDPRQATDSKYIGQYVGKSR
jgi:hypothetical protein